jgi:ribose/xylose/arabinose/galactoside ABC-type transport system permease subunit
LIAAEPFMLVFRFLHIVSGALWFGSAFLFVGIIGPSAAEVGPSAGPLLSVAVKKRRVAKIITWLGMITVTAGWVMWIKDMRDYGGLGDWLGTGFGIGLTIGGVLATVTFFIGYFGVGRNVERLVDLGDRIAAAGGPPSSEQQAEMARIGAGLERHGKTDLMLLFLAVAAMATARYW